MVRYLLKRIVYFFCTCFAVALVAFLVTVASPGDPVDRLTSYAQGGQEVFQPVRENEKARLRRRLGLDLPVFYLSLHSAAEPDTLHRIFPVTERVNLEKLLETYGNWPAVSDWYRSVLSLQHSLDAASKEYNPDGIRERVARLREVNDSGAISLLLSDLSEITQHDSSSQHLIPGVQRIQESYRHLSAFRPTWRSYVPVLQFNAQNQFHRWLVGGDESRGILRGDFGISYINRQPVTAYILEKLPWTLMLTLLAVSLAYLISIPLALQMVKKPGGPLDRRLNTFLQLLYSMPAFWIGALLLMVFANPDILPVFPASGVQPVEGYPPGASLFRKAIISLPYFVLPAIALIFTFVALLTRVFRASLGEELRKDYCRTALAKGISPKRVRTRHALRNTLLPAVTLFAEIFPLVIGGSVLIETIFSIPGMGWGIFQAIEAQDYPVMVSVFTLTGLVTMVGYLFTDILYAFLDPRIRYT